MFTLTEKEILNLEKLKNKEILITGGSGFIGTWLTQLLLYLNDTCNFNITLYLIARQITSNLEALISSRKDIIFIKNDIRNIREFPKDIAYIIHAASSPDNRIYMSNPIESMNIISDGTKNTMENALLLEKLEKIVHLSWADLWFSG